MRTVIRPANYPNLAPGRVLNEGSSLALLLSHLNASEALSAPTTLRYRLDNLTTGEEIIDWTSVSTPGSTNTVTLPVTAHDVDREIELLAFLCEIVTGSETALDAWEYTVRSRGLAAA